MLKCLPGADLIAKSIDSEYLTPSLDEVRANRSKLSVAGEEGDHSSAIADGSFPRSTIDDILPPDYDSREHVPAQLAAYLSSKFVSESRDAYADALRLGDTRGCIKALETGLGRLEKICRYDAGVAGIAARIEMLGSLERPDEARALLYDLCAAVERLLGENAKSIVERHQTHTTHTAKNQERVLHDTLYEEEYKNAHVMLDAATVSNPEVISFFTL
jgi:hypothetical protein